MMKKQPWHDNFLLSLRELADLNAQRRAWLGGDESGIPVASELLNEVFDDSGLTELLKRGPVFSKKADQALKDLNKLSAQIDLDQSTENLVTSKHWLQITLLAAVALKAVNKALES